LFIQYKGLFKQMYLTDLRPFDLEYHLIRMSFNKRVDLLLLRTSCGFKRFNIWTEVSFIHNTSPEFWSLHRESIMGQRKAINGTKLTFCLIYGTIDIVLGPDKIPCSCTMTANSFLIKLDLQFKLPIQSCLRSFCLRSLESF